MLNEILQEFYHDDELSDKLKKLGYEVCAHGFESIKNSSVKLALSLNCSEFPGCCGISVLHNLALNCDDYYGAPSQNVIVQLLTLILEVACDLQSAENAFVMYSTIPEQIVIIRALKAAGFAPAARPQTNPNTGNKITVWIKALK